MSTRSEAQELLDKMLSCRPKSFFCKIDDSQKGINFVLFYLAKADHEVLAGELARELNVSTARIAALLKTMEKNGLIERCHSAADARQTVVKITQEGIDCTERMNEQILDKMGILLDKIGKDELDEFIRISEKIREALGE